MLRFFECERAFVGRSYHGAGGRESIASLCRPVRWQLALREIKKKPERAVHGLGILENLRNVSIEKHNVGACFVLFLMFSPPPRGKIIFRSHLVTTGRITPIHTFSAPLGRRHGR